MKELSFSCDSIGYSLCKRFCENKSYLSRSEVIAAFDNQSASLIKLNNGTILYLREINRFLGLVCILRDYNFSRQGIIDYNYICFRDAVHKIFAVRLSKKLALGSFYDDTTDFNDDSTIDYMESRNIDSPNANLSDKYFAYRG